MSICHSPATDSARPPQMLTHILGVPSATNTQTYITYTYYDWALGILFKQIFKYTYF